ncbi:MAG: ATP-binding protein [Rhizomicrobium sp.]
MIQVDSLSQTIAGLGARPASRGWNLEKALARLLKAIAELFDAISIEFLDRLPNTVTVSAIVLLLATAHVVVVGLLAAVGLGRNAWAMSFAMAITSIFVGIPVVGFGQMQYRRARSSLLASRSLTDQLIIARDEAEAANKEKSKFLASMSHELRTPLNAIIGFAEILKNETFGTVGSSRYVEYAYDIFTSGHHLLSLVNDVLDLSRIESASAKIRMDEPVELVMAVRDVCRLMSMTASNGGVVLADQLPEQPIRIAGNERMIQQILLNLVSNAVKFTPPDGLVVVRLQLDPAAGAVVTVSDTGIGMTPEEAAVALQPFGQIDSYVSRKHKGTGLGLPLAKSMIDMHGGGLRVVSTPGKGTSVGFNIPNERLIDAAAHGFNG